MGRPAASHAREPAPAVATTEHAHPPDDGAFVGAPLAAVESVVAGLTEAAVDGCALAPPEAGGGAGAALGSALAAKRFEPGQEPVAPGGQ